MVCDRPDRVLIELAAKEGTNAGDLAKQFSGVSRYSISRHMAAHVRERLSLASGGAVGASGAVGDTQVSTATPGTSLADLYAMRAALLPLYRTAIEEQRHRDVEAHGQLLLRVASLIADLTGERNRPPDFGQSDIAVHPSMKAFQQFAAAWIDRNPDKRQTIIEFLEAASAGI